MESLPIGDYALLSDCRSAALVSRDGHPAPAVARSAKGDRVAPLAEGFYAGQAVR